jgi:hypothetical protein
MRVSVNRPCSVWMWLRSVCVMYKPYRVGCESLAGAGVDAKLFSLIPVGVAGQAQVMASKSSRRATFTNLRQKHPIQRSEYMDMSERSW